MKLLQITYRSEFVARLVVGFTRLTFSKQVVSTAIQSCVSTRAPSKYLQTIIIECTGIRTGARVREPVH